MASRARNQARDIEWLDLATLKPDPLNPKTHDLPTIDASIGRFGMLEPIILDGRTGQIISGHGRLATLLGMHERGEPPPDGIPVGAGGAWLAPVVTGWSSKNEDDARAAVIALNRTVETGGWDYRALLDQLDTLSASDALVGVGFGDEDIAALRETVLTGDQQTFLGDLLDSTAENPFDGSLMDRTDDVSMTFPMTAAQRSACMAALRATQSEHELGTLTDALLHTLGHHELIA